MVVVQTKPAFTTTCSTIRRLFYDLLSSSSLAFLYLFLMAIVFFSNLCVIIGELSWDWKGIGCGCIPHFSQMIALEAKCMTRVCIIHYEISHQSLCALI